MVKNTKKTKKTKKTNKNHLRKTNKTKGGGLLAAPVVIRNVKYIKTLENRLVNQWGDYDWVQARRTKNWMPTKPLSDYTDNDYTSNNAVNKSNDSDDSDDSNGSEEAPKKSGWFSWR